MKVYDLLEVSKLLSRIAELEQQLADKEVEIKRLGEVVMQTVANGNKQRHDAVSHLEEQNLALLAAIEELKKTISTMCSETSSHYERLELSRKSNAIQPSADLLEQRDRVRDAAVLRKLKHTAIHDELNSWLDELAAARLDGSWVPELGDGS